MAEIEAEQRKTRSEAADFLRLLADELDAGSVTLRLGEETVTVEPPDEVQFEVEVDVAPAGRSGDERGSLEVELEWPA